MKFNIVQITKDRPVYYLLHDPLRTLCFALEDLGHDVTITRDTLVKGSINIIACGQRLFPKEIVAIAKSGIPYIVYQTEVFSESGLNYFSSQDKEFSRILQDNYIYLLKHAVMIWECFDFNQAYLQNLGIQSDIIYHGYSPSMEGRPKKQTLDLDVCFFGSISPYRRGVLQELMAQKVKIGILNVEPPLMRDDMIRRTKINLSIRANDDTMSHLPHFRVLTGLYHHTMTISEQAHGQDWLSEMVDMVPAEEFAQHVVNTIRDGSYADRAQEYREKFLQLPMVDFMEGLVAKLKDRL